ncbi:MAG: NfeD family protein [Gammaproteobacteria bacterium]|nr:MAG: NfeD family protein [Gammaproteobacteria bacterium]
MDELLRNLAPWHWALLGIVLVILEILAPGIYLLWLGIAAGLVGALLWLFPELGWQAQFIAFAILSIASVALGRAWLARNPSPTDEPTLNRRGEQYIGRVVTLEEPIVNGRGKIRLDDTTWKIEGPDCEAGSRVRISGTEGVVLRVEKAEQ